MSNLILPVAGAFVGSFFGSYGAQIGWMIGSAAQASKQKIHQAKAGDLRLQTSQYGVAVPYVIGKQRVSGNVIWSSSKREYEKRYKTGKGGPTTVATGYRIDMMIAICKGPIAGISRVWADGKLIIDSRNAAKPLIGQLYVGDMDQNPDPTYQSAVGDDAPAYRGLAYIALSDFDLGASGRVPMFSFEVVRGGTI